MASIADDLAALSISSEKAALPAWVPPKVTSEELEWADILTVDLSLYETDKQKLIDTVATALQRDGFFYVIGHDISPEIVSSCYHQLNSSFQHSNLSFRDNSTSVNILSTVFQEKKRKSTVLRLRRKAPS